MNADEISSGGGSLLPGVIAVRFACADARVISQLLRIRDSVQEAAANAVP